ncbi:hypothetical protein OA321_04315 [Pelagibacteraceae bacterium]|nr:hypothetical protein [Pelagibacteraceae bacterium]
MKSKNSRIKLRYGENPNQKGFLISDKKNTISNYQIGGRQISYNNLIDLDSGLKCLKEFLEPTSIILKHTNPCGVASAKNIEIAFNKSYESDPKSAFGGIILLNRKVTSRLAMKIYENFFEMIVALDFDRDALSILGKKKNLIILKIPNIKKINLEYRSTLFGDLYQTADLVPINRKFLSLVSNKKGSAKSIDDLIFSLKVVKHLKSNAIVLSRNKQTLGLGHGHTNRVDALYHAIKNMNKYFKKGIFVCASDGFFPFVDSINLLNKNGCNAVAQPGGSINDNVVISFSTKNKISLYFTKNRLFKH